MGTNLSDTSGDASSGVDVIRGEAQITFADQMYGMVFGRFRYWSAIAALTFVLYAIFEYKVGFGNRGSSTVQMLLTAPELPVCLFLCLWLFFLYYPFSRLNKDQRTVSYKITEKFIATADAAGASNNYPWTVVKRITESGRLFIVTFNTGGERHLAKRGFSTASIMAMGKLSREKLGSRAKVWS